jgi:hypothetical protein
MDFRYFVDNVSDAVGVESLKRLSPQIRSLDVVLFNLPWSSLKQIVYSPFQIF